MEPTTVSGVGFSLPGVTRSKAKVRLLNAGHSPSSLDSPCLRDFFYQMLQQAGYRGRLHRYKIGLQLCNVGQPNPCGIKSKAQKHQESPPKGAQSQQ